MHFTTLFILKGETLETKSSNEIQEEFYDKFCYGCGENRPKYLYWCDWFQVGGRWPDILKAKKGIHCGRGWSNDNAPIKKGEFSIVEIKDLTEPIDKEQIYAIATRSRIYQKSNNWGGSEEGVDNEKYTELLNKINNKQINGVIALIDCHD